VTDEYRGRVIREAAERHDAAVSDVTAARAALARVLSWFADGGTRRDAMATRAQLARAYADGGLTVPEELRRFL